MHPTYALVLAEARSCLPALADAAGSADCSSRFERLLIDLDVLTDDSGPATYQIVGLALNGLVDRAEVALRRLVLVGADAPNVERLIVRLHGCAPGAPLV
ncbi:MAG: hypothetical protein ACTHNS_00525 [Marmoricola sp.]